MLEVERGDSARFSIRHSPPLLEKTQPPLGGPTTMACPMVDMQKDNKYPHEQVEKSPREEKCPYEEVEKSHVGRKM